MDILNFNSIKNKISKLLGIRLGYKKLYWAETMWDLSDLIYSIFYNKLI